MFIYELFKEENKIEKIYVYIGMVYVYRYKTIYFFKLIFSNLVSDNT